MYSSELPIKDAIKKEITKSRHSMKIAFLILIFPDAMGLFFFLGCFLSMSLSNMSLRIYIELAKKQKERKAMKLFISKSNSKNFIPKKIGRKMKRFFTYCFTLKSFKISIINFYNTI